MREEGRQGFFSSLFPYPARKGGRDALPGFFSGFGQIANSGRCMMEFGRGGIRGMGSGAEVVAEST